MIDSSVLTRRVRSLFVGVCVCAAASAQAQQVYTLQPVADTTIFGEINGGTSFDTVSDGKGESLWLSVTAAGVARRALMRFDLSMIPADLTVTSVTLTLFESRARDAHAVDLHRLTAGWGEGNSNGGSQGNGAPAQAGDATWRWRVFGGPAPVEWASRGGDYDAAASASIQVAAANEFYTWGSTPQMVSDVQGWLTNPAANFGWIVVGDESVSQNAKRFDSLQSPFLTQRPTLLVTVVPEPGTWTLAAMGVATLLTVASRRQRGA